MALAEKVIEHVKKYPILFDIAHEGYKDLRTKEKIWVAIAKELKEDPEEVKKKWKNLKDTYVRFMKQRRQSKKGKKWQWATHMEGFNPPLTFESRTMTRQLFRDECTKIESAEDDSNLDPISTENMEISYNDSVFLDYQKSSESTLAQDDVTSFSISTVSKKRKHKNECSLTSSMESLIKHLKTQQQPELDETDMLFLAYSRNIKTFSKKRQAIAKMKVSQVIMEQELQNIEDQLQTDNNLDVYYRSEACSSSSVNQSRPNSPYQDLDTYQDTKPC